MRRLLTLIWLSVRWSRRRNNESGSSCVGAVVHTSEVLCLIEAGGQCPSHCLDSRQARAVRPGWLAVPAGDSHQDDSTLSAQAVVEAVSADWLLQLCLRRGLQEFADDHLQTQGEQAAGWPPVQLFRGKKKCDTSTTPTELHLG